MSDTQDAGGVSPRPYSRRRFLARLGALGAAGFAGPVVAGASASADVRRHLGPVLLGSAKRTSPIKQIVVLCQENHSFDHYLGSYTNLPAGYGIPSTFAGWTTKPFSLGTSNLYNPDHSWTNTHKEWNNGKMDGFVSADGTDAMGYHTRAHIPFYYSLIPEFTLCARYHCGVLGPTFPNRMVLYAGTSGGWTDNSALNNTLSWPTIITLLHNHGITYKNYNLHSPPDYSTFALWKSNFQQKNLNVAAQFFYSDCKAGTLPQVSFITNAPPYDEHPLESNLVKGMNLMESVINSIRNSPQWDSTAVLLTWDEGGGFFDHVPPTLIDHFGSGIRVPMFVISPLAKQGYVDTTYSDHASVLKFIEHVFGLPTLASINHEFDTSTPKVGQGGGKPFPPRDGSSEISDLTQCFTVAV